MFYKWKDGCGGRACSGDRASRLRAASWERTGASTFHAQAGGQDKVTPHSSRGQRSQTREEGLEVRRSKRILSFTRSFIHSKTRDTSRTPSCESWPPQRVNHPVRIETREWTGSGHQGSHEGVEEGPPVSQWSTECRRS